MFTISTSKKIVKGLGISISVWFAIFFVMFVIGIVNMGYVLQRSKEVNKILSGYIGGMIGCVCAGLSLYYLYTKLKNKEVHFGSRVDSN